MKMVIEKDNSYKSMFLVNMEFISPCYKEKVRKYR